MRKYTHIGILFLFMFGFAVFYGCYNILETGYLKKDLLISDKNGTEGVKLYFGSFVKSGSITVWVDTDGSLYREPEKLLKYGEVKNDSMLTFTSNVQNGLREAKFSTKISPTLLSSDITEVTAEAEEVYYEHCSTCHQAPDLTKKYNAQMKGVMESMVVHTNMPVEDAELLARYVSLYTNN